MAIGDAVIGALRVSLSADTAALEDGLKRASKTVEKFGGALDGLKKILAIVAGTALVHFIKEAVKVGEEIEKATKKLGISAEAFQEWTHAADIAGVSHEALVKAMEKLQRGIGGTGEDVDKFQKALGRLGFTLADIKKLAPEQQFVTVSDALSKVSNAAERTSIGTDLMGRGFGEAAAVLTLSRVELEKFAEEARRLGFILSDETIKKAAAADDEFDRIGKAFKVAGVNLAAEFLPALIELRKLVTSSDFQDAVKTLAKGLGDIITWITANPQAVAAFFGALAGARIGSVAGSVGSLTGALIGAGAAFQAARTQISMTTDELAVAKGNVYNTEQAIKALKDQFFATGGSAEEFETKMLKLQEDQAHYKIGVEALTKKLNELKNQGEATHLELNKKQDDGTIFDPEHIKKIEDAVNRLNVQTAEAQGKFLKWPEGAVQAGVALGIFKVNADGVVTTIAGLAGKENEFIAAHERLRAALTISPFEQFKLDIQNLNFLFANQGVISIQTWEAAVKKSAVSAASAVKKMSDDMLGGWTELFMALGKQNKGFFQAGQSLAIVMAVINTAEAVTKALAAYPPPLSYVAAAAAAAKGAAQIVTIKSQKYTGAAAGGSFKVPGGSMGVDTKLIPMALAPGERVDVTPASKAGTPANEGYLELTPVRPRDFFTGEMVREMVFSIDQWMRDGGTGVKFASRQP